MPSTNTPNMNLIAPTVGQQPGPTWAQNVNTDLSIIDAHDHTSGFGVPITPAGLSITSDLSFMSNNAISLRSIRMDSQGSPLSAAADNQSLSVSGVDLYYLDGNGNSIRITQSGGIAGSPGSISGLASPASVTYVSGTPAFVFQADSNKAANLDGGSLTIRKLTTSSPGITITPAAGLSGNYTLTLPAAPPATTKILTMDNLGNVGVVYDVDNVTLEVASNALRIKDNTPLTGNVTITGSLQTGTGLNVGSGVVNLAGPELIGRTLSTIDINDPSNSQSHPIVVSGNPSHSGLIMLRAKFDNFGNLISGEGLSVTGHPATGTYTIAYTTAFFDVPVLSLTAGVPGVSFATTINYSASTASGCTVNIKQGSGAVDPSFIDIIAIGQRP